MRFHHQMQSLQRHHRSDLFNPIHFSLDVTRTDQQGARDLPLLLVHPHELAVLPKDGKMTSDRSSMSWRNTQNRNNGVVSSARPGLQLQLVIGRDKTSGVRGTQ